MRGILALGFSIWLSQAAAPDDMTIEHEGRTVIRVNRADYTLSVFPLIHSTKLQALLESVASQTDRPPVNARIDASGAIEAERPGVKLDRRKFEELCYQYFYGKGPISLPTPQIVVYPKVDGELLSLIREKPIGSYATYFHAGNKNRSNNIALAAQAINNTVVFPNETFSFNKIVGVRNQHKGYRRAKVIVRGELAEDIGGGICQVSSTLYNAVDRAGLHILERYSHSRHVPYVLPGRDATVSWNGPDFAFRNPYNQPVLIRAFAGSGRLYVSVYSSDFIDFHPRNVPGMSERLPEEVPINQGIHSMNEAPSS
ncbi:VanW family protein [Cohnella panacarvi]|uniref:VanW family protein n=1 Tax=Cohnella panacarvi TaxID=400776 RepID=UPI00047C7B02|nr:VanW family protein [Cohnella panacarvi]